MIVGFAVTLGFIVRMVVLIGVSELRQHYKTVIGLLCFSALTAVFAMFLTEDWATLPFLLLACTSLSFGLYYRPQIMGTVSDASLLVLALLSWFLLFYQVTVAEAAWGIWAVLLPLVPYSGLVLYVLFTPRQSLTSVSTVLVILYLVLTIWVSFWLLSDVYYAAVTPVAAAFLGFIAAPFFAQVWYLALAPWAIKRGDRYVYPFNQLIAASLADYDMSFGQIWVVVGLTAVCGYAAFVAVLSLPAALAAALAIPTVLRFKER